MALLNVARFLFDFHFHNMTGSRLLAVGGEITSTTRPFFTWLYKVAKVYPSEPETGKNG